MRRLQEGVRGAFVRQRAFNRARSGTGKQKAAWAANQDARTPSRIHNAVTKILFGLESRAFNSAHDVFGVFSCRAGAVDSGSAGRAALVRVRGTPSSRFVRAITRC